MNLLHESKSAEADLSAGPDGRRRLSGTSPPLQRLGSSTGPEETRTGGRRLDSELQEDDKAQYMDIMVVVI